MRLRRFLIRDPMAAETLSVPEHRSHIAGRIARRIAGPIAAVPDPVVRP
jgi:hypothetical protein